MTKSCKKIIEAIEALFGDTSVGAEVTLDDLEEIWACVEGKIDAIRSDLRSAE